MPLRTAAALGIAGLLACSGPPSPEADRPAGSTDAARVALSFGAGGAGSAVTPVEGAWRQTEFAIGGFLHSRANDPASAGDPRALRAIADAGIRLLVNGDAFDSTEARATVRALDQLRREDPDFALRALILYTRPANPTIVSFNPAVPGNRGAIEHALQPGWGINSPSVEGYVLWDEPWADTSFRSIRELTWIVDTLPATRGKLPYVNLYPIYVSGQSHFDSTYGRDKVAAYRRYLDRYLGMFGAGRPAPVLCVDHYPFQVPRTRRDFFLNLELMREAVERHRAVQGSVPMWLVVQLAPFRLPPGRFPSPPDLARVRWQVSGALAYGVKGIFYWTLVPGVDGHFGAGLLDEAGARTPRYDALRDVNATLAEFGPTLMRLDPVAAYHQNVTGEEGLADKAIASRSRSREVIEDMTGGANQGLVGWLRDRWNGEDYLFVVNKDLRVPQSFTLQLAAAPRAVEWKTGSGSRDVMPGPGARSFTTALLEPGAGALYRLVR